MNREKLGAFNIHYQNAGVERIDTIMVLLVLLSRRKEKGGKWGGTYADFNRDFPWGGLSRKEGEAYLDETLGELAGKGCLSFDKSSRGGFSVELKDPPDSFRYFEELASPQLLDWIEKLQSAEELALYLVSASWFLVQNEAPTELTADKLMNNFGFWRGKSRKKYLGRQFRRLEELGLLSFDPTRANTVIGINELLPPSGDIEPSSYIHPTDDREPFSPEQRESIYRQDGGKCSYCGIAIGEDERFDVDHVIPIYLNGARKDERNLATSCPECNGKRKWFKFTGAASKSDVWLNIEPRYWRQGRVVEIAEESTIESEKERRVPLITLTKERPVTRDLHPGQSQDNSHE